MDGQKKDRWERQINKQIETKIDGQRGRQKGRQTDRQKNSQADFDRQTERQLDRQKDRQKDRQVENRQLASWIDRKIDCEKGQIDNNIFRLEDVFRDGKQDRKLAIQIDDRQKK